MYDYLFDKTGFSFFRKAKLIPFSNNPLEGVNNGLKSNITDYARRNVGQLPGELEEDLKSESKNLKNLNYDIL